MPAILTIGYKTYLIKSEASAMAALKALSEAIEVRRGFDAKTGDYYYPEESPHDRERGITIIRAGQLRPSKTVRQEEPREVKQLDFNGKVHYQDGGDT